MTEKGASGKEERVVGCEMGKEVRAVSPQFRSSGSCEARTHGGERERNELKRSTKCCELHTCLYTTKQGERVQRARALMTKPGKLLVDWKVRLVRAEQRAGTRDCRCPASSSYPAPQAHSVGTRPQARQGERVRRSSDPFLGRRRVVALATSCRQLGPPPLCGRVISPCLRRHTEHG